MADYSGNATQLSAPQGAGTQPLAPVQQQFVDTSIMPVVADVSTFLVKGLQEKRKIEAQQAEDSVVGDYLAKQRSIDNAVERGDLRRDVATTRSRALFTEMMANNPQYVKALNQANTAMRGGGTLGAVEDDVKRMEDIQKTRITNAQSRGVTIYSWMSPETLERSLSSAESSKRAETELEQTVKKNAELRAQGAEQRTIADRNTKQDSIRILSGMAGDQVGRLSSLISDISGKVGSSMTFEEAQLVITKEFAQVEGALTAAAGVNPELAGSYRSLFTDLKLLADKAVNPTTKAQVLKDEYNVIVYRSMLMGITSDPKMKAVVAANQMLGGNAVTALNASAPITEFIAKMSTIDPTSGEYVPEVVGNPTVEKDVLTFLNKGIEKLNSNGYADNPKAKGEATNSVNNLLKQVGDKFRTGQLTPDKMQDLSKFFASPQYGKFVASGAITPQAAETAKMAWQQTYVPAVIEQVGGRLNTISQQFQSSGGGISPVNIVDLMDIKFSGAGITFVPKNVPVMEQYRQGWQQKAVADLNSVKAGINQLIHIGAHLEGSTDYAQYWENNKHLYLPSIYPDPNKLKIGDVIDGYKYKGGNYNDAANWESTGAGE